MRVLAVEDHECGDVSLRTKLGDPSAIETVREGGYRFCR
jgi:hypothetical protein